MACSEFQAAAARKASRFGRKARKYSTLCCVDDPFRSPVEPHVRLPLPLWREALYPTTLTVRYP